METNIFRIFCLFILCLICINYNLSADSNIGRDPYEILFIGSSYFNYNDLPALFDSLAGAAGHDVFIDRSTTNGLYLSDHVTRPYTIEKIYQQDWDYVILQGVGTVVAYPDYFTDHPVYPALIALRDMILDNCSSTKLIFCMPWAFEDGMTWLPDWTDTYLDMQQYIYDNTLLYSEEIGFEISPVGWAWRTVLIQQDFPLHYLHMSDWNHPSLRGSYLMACVIFSHVYLESAAGLETEIELPLQEMIYFQTIGSNTVLDDLEIWNISITYSGQDEIPGSREISLYNYPNPFNPYTEIRCQISGLHTSNAASSTQAGASGREIDLTIFNLRGQKIKTLTFSPSQLPFPSVIWDGTDEAGDKVPSGIYLSKLSYGNMEATRKMLLLK